MSDSDQPLEWVEFAEVDLDTARLALRRKKISTYIVCFHAQQSIEKYLKAILILRQVKFPKIHDLRRLSDLLAENGILLGMSATQLDKVTKYSVMVRYPGDQPVIEEAKEAVETAKPVRKFSRKHLGLK